MVKRLTATLTVLAALGVAPAVFAGGTLTPINAYVLDLGEMAGPTFAGTDVAWVTAGPGKKYAVTTGGPHEKVQYVKAPRGGWMHVAASSTQVAFGLSVTRCTGPACAYGEYRVLLQKVFAGPLGQPVTPLSGCPSENPVVDASGDAIAYRDTCSGGVTVHDLSPGHSDSRRSFPGDHNARIAGPYLAVDSGTDISGPNPLSPSKITVYDWRTGTQVYAVDAPSEVYPEFDIQDDGILVFTRSVPHGGYFDSNLYWASPADPTPHFVTRDYYFGELRIAGNRVAGDWPHYRVFDLPGHLLAAAAVRYAGLRGNFDFDGSRLVWATQPCAVTAIVTWDLTGSPPALPIGRCPYPRVPRAVAKLRKRRIRVQLACPRSPGRGCRGELLVELRGTGVARFAMGSEQRRGVEVTLSRGAACRLARSKRRRVWVDFGKGTGYVGQSRVNVKLRRVGHARGCHSRR